MDEPVLTDKYRIFHPSDEIYIFFSAARGTFSKTDLIIGHKSNLKKKKKNQHFPCLLSDHVAIQLEMNVKRNNRNHKILGDL